MLTVSMFLFGIVIGLVWMHYVHRYDIEQAEFDAEIWRIRYLAERESNR